MIHENKIYNRILVPKSGKSSKKVRRERNFYKKNGLLKRPPGPDAASYGAAGFRLYRFLRAELQWAETFPGLPAENPTGKPSVFLCFFT